MSQIGFYYNESACIGCRACQVACKDRNDVSDEVALRWVTSYEAGEFPRVGVYHFAAACNHCAEPACVANCPTGAMFKSEDGSVLHDDEVCIGCKTCVASCPYGAPQYSEGKDLIMKCDSCKALRDAGMNPVCVDACPMRALEFGELSDLQSRHGDGAVSALPCLPSDETTHPSLLIEPRQAAWDASFSRVIV